MNDDTAPGLRARNRAAIEAQLRVVARRHLARDGAAALSLRAVARDLEMAPSALYRYVRNRDDLLTLLIIDAYNALSDTVDGALDDAASPRSQFVTLARAVRRWALANPAEYALVFGSPVPGYHAPAERTHEAGNRIYLQLLSIASAVDEPPVIPGFDPAAQRAADDALSPLAADPAVSGLISTATLGRALASWNLVLGTVTSELFEHLGPITEQPGTLFDSVAELAAALLFGPDD
ncbi:MAG: WHG domain-containing protein [Gordonia sp. (in: high G+C Gram-positive bacteria)]